MKISFLGFAACLVFATIISHQVLTTTFLLDHNISITLSESDAEITIKAKFPASKSSAVTDLLITHFKLSESMDLRDTRISNDQASDPSIYFNIQSKPGSLKIVLVKTNNNSAGEFHFKSFSEKLKSVLAQ